MRYINKSVSRGGIYCANGWFSKEKHEIKEGEIINWLEDVLKNGKVKLNGYCDWCYNKMKREEAEIKHQESLLPND